MVNFLLLIREFIILLFTLEKLLQINIIKTTIRNFSDWFSFNGHASSHIFASTSLLQYLIFNLPTKYAHYYIYHKIRCSEEVVRLKTVLYSTLPNHSILSADVLVFNYSRHAIINFSIISHTLYNLLLLLSSKNDKM